MAGPSNISITIRSWSVPAGILGAVLLVGQIALSSVLGAAQGTSNPYEIYDPLLYVLYNSLFDGALMLFAVGLVGLLYGHRQAAEQQHRHQQSSSSSRWLARMGLFLALGAGASAAVSILFALMVGLWPALSVVGAFFTQLLAVLCLVVGLGLLGIISVMRSAALEGWVSSLRWRWVLLIFGIGVVAALLSEMLEIVMSSYIPVVDIKGTHLGHVLVTFFVAVWIARKVGTLPVLYGILVGLISGIINQLYFHVLVVTPGTLNWREVMITVPLSVVAGWLGGVVARATLAEQETLYRASRAIGEASGQQDIVDAIGEHLADPQVSHVALWQDVVSGAEEGGDTSELSLLAVWMPWVARVWGPGVWRPGLRLDVAQLPALATLKRHQHSPVVLKVRKLAASERAVWEHQGIRSAVLLPLVVSSGAAQLGVLMVASRSIYGFSRVKMRTYSTLAAQVALVLENLRLIEEAQQAGVSSERQRLAHEIHDTLAQGFTSIVMNLEAAEGMLPSGLSSVQQYLDQARSIARDSLAEARRLMWALRPESLERSSLPEALSRLAESFSEESGGTAAASTTVTGTPQPLTPEIEVTLLRVAQEALANCRKHAQASRVAITLSYMNNLVALNVQDDGVGFDPNQLGGGIKKEEEPAGAQSTGGFGLVGMRERVEQLRGTLLVESAPAEGTTLMVAIPLATTSNQPPGTPEALKATSSSPSSPRETL